MEDAAAKDFNINKLYRWFSYNLRTLKHKDLSKVDPNWIQNTYCAEANLY